MIRSSNIEKLIKNYENKKLAHAFLIETDNKDLALNDILDLVKVLNCPEIYKDECNNCNLCHLIQKLQLPNLHVIYPDGQAIKKEQIEKLKRDLASIPFISRFNIYVINESEKLNSSSANAMLKFIEEPEANILGFFITNNRENVINTVKSRCEIIRAFYTEENENNLDFYKNYNNDLYDLVIEYLYEVEFEKKKSILYNKTILDKKLERNDMVIFFKIILEIYNSLLKNTSIPNKLLFLKEFEKKEILRRIKIVIDILERLDYNSNLNLILDRFVIRLGV